MCLFFCECMANRKNALVIMNARLTYFPRENLVRYHRRQTRLKNSMGKIMENNFSFTRGRCLCAVQNNGIVITRGAFHNWAPGLRRINAGDAKPSVYVHFLYTSLPEPISFFAISYTALSRKQHRSCVINEHFSNNSETTGRRQRAIARNKTESIAPLWTNTVSLTKQIPSYHFEKFVLIFWNRVRRLRSDKAVKIVSPRVTSKRPCISTSIQYLWASFIILLVFHQWKLTKEKMIKKLRDLWQLFVRTYFAFTTVWYFSLFLLSPTKRDLDSVELRKYLLEKSLIGYCRFLKVSYNFPSQWNRLDQFSLGNKCFRFVLQSQWYLTGLGHTSGKNVLWDWVSKMAPWHRFRSRLLRHGNWEWKKNGDCFYKILSQKSQWLSKEKRKPAWLGVDRLTCGSIVTETIGSSTIGLALTCFRLLSSYEYRSRFFIFPRLVATSFSSNPACISLGPLRSAHASPISVDKKVAHCCNRARGKKIIPLLLYNSREIRVLSSRPANLSIARHRNCTDSNRN